MDAHVAFKLPDVLQIAWQISTLGVASNGRRLSTQPDSCNQLLEDLLIVPRGGDLPFAAPFTHNLTVNTSSREDIFALLKSAIKARQLPRSELRVIVHPFESNSGEFGITDGGPFDGKFFSPFIVLNALKQRSDNLTLLHEMIHATGLLIHDDDRQEPDSFPDASSVFSTNDNRNHIRDAHVERLRKMPWRQPWPF